MADRVPIPMIHGSLTSFVDVDIFVGYFPAARTLTSFQPAVLGAPSGGSVSVDLRTAIDGGGEGLSATIPDGAKVPASPVTGSIDVAAGTSLYARITAESGSAAGLYGQYEIDVAAGISAALTTLARLKAFRGISGSGSDDDLSTVIAGVSKRMQAHMARSIVSQAITEEKHDASGLSDTIILGEYPVIVPPAVVLRDRNGEEIDSTTYEVDEDAGFLIRVTAGEPSNWDAGRRAYEVDYTSGYATIPEDLAFWATKQAAYEWLQFGQAGRLGNRGEILDPGGEAQYLTGEWAPGVLNAMAPYRNLRVF